MKFNNLDYVRKIKGSQWRGCVVGTYSTSLTPEGYCVESIYEPGSVQIYPAQALELFFEPMEAPATLPCKHVCREDSTVCEICGA